MKFTPENVTKLLDNQVFVYGSNSAGRHGAGAAKVAYEKFGAEMGVGDGLVGQSYAIATKGHQLEILSLKDIEYNIVKFLAVCNANQDKEFVLTKIGTGLSRYSCKDIASIFRKYKPLPKNIIWPEEFYNIIFYNS